MNWGNAILCGKNSRETRGERCAPSTEKALAQNHDYATITERECASHESPGEGHLALRGTCTSTPGAAS